MAENLRFDLLANDRASAVFNKVGRSAADTESTFSRVGRGLATVGRVAATGLAIGVGAGVVALGKFVGEARESERVGRLTESIIKSTGGAANITAAQVGALATSISNKTGVDDEAIQTGSNLLLTFKNVRNEVGKGNDVFNQATAAAVDLSAAGFGSIDSASKMLGKALNDPIKGITALSRAGVTFTQQQQDQITAMTETGNVLGAQKLIMAEVQSQVGGAAAATSTAMDKAKVAASNLGESVGTLLLPMIDGLASMFSTRVVPAVSGFIGQMQSGKGAGGSFAEGLRSIGDSARLAFDFFLTSVVPILIQFAGFVTGSVIPAVASLVGFLNQHRTAATALAIGIAALVVVTQAHAAVLAMTAAGGLAQWIAKMPVIVSLTRAWTAVQWAMNAALTANPIGLVIMALVALGAGLVLAYRKSETFRDIVNSAFNGIKAIVQAVIPAITNIVQAGMQAIGRVFDVIGALLRGDWQAAWNGIRSITSSMTGVVSGLVSAGLNAIKGLFIAAAVAFHGTIVDAWGKISGAFSNGIETVTGFVRSLPGKITSALSGLFSIGASVGADLARGIINGIGNMAGSVMSAAKGLADKAVSAIKGALHMNSPSKVTYAIGEFFGKGFEGGIKARTKAVVSAVGELVKKALDRLKTLKDQAREVVEGAANATMGGFDFSSLGAVNQDTGTAANVTDQLAGFAAQAQSFAASLAAAASHGLNADLIGRIAAMGATQGLTAAQALAAMDAAQVASANASIAAANQYAQQVGQTVLTTTSVPGDIARQEATLETLKAIRTDFQNEDRSTTFIINDATDPDAVVRAIRRYVRRNGKLRGVTAKED